MSIFSSISYTDSHPRLSCATAPPLTPPLATPSCVMNLLLNHNTPSLQSCHRSYVVHISYRCSVWYFVNSAWTEHDSLSPSAAIGSNCEDTAPVSQCCLDPHFYPTSNLLARSYFQANTGFSLFGRCPLFVVWPLPRNCEWFLSFGLTIRRAIASTPASAATAGYLLLVCRGKTLSRLAKSVFLINTYWTYRLE